MGCQPQAELRSGSPKREEGREGLQVVAFPVHWYGGVHSHGGTPTAGWSIWFTFVSLWANSVMKKNDELLWSMIPMRLWVPGPTWPWLGHWGVLSWRSSHRLPLFSYWRWISAQELAALLWEQEQVYTWKHARERDLMWLGPEAAALFGWMLRVFLRWQWGMLRDGLIGLPRWKKLQPSQQGRYCSGEDAEFCGNKTAYLSIGKDSCNNILWQTSPGGLQQNKIIGHWDDWDDEGKPIAPVCWKMAFIWVHNSPCWFDL